MTARLSIHQAMEHRTLRTDGCWLWTGNINSATGYGRLGFGGTNLVAHRVAYELAKGPIPTGLVLDHLCRVRHCVNPDHLEPVTIRENTLRGVGIPAQRARADKCKRGHAYDDANTVIQRGYRLCRKCRNSRNAAHYERLRQARPPRPLASHCNRGHEFTEDNVYRSPKTGHRQCRACRTMHVRALRAARKECAA